MTVNVVFDIDGVLACNRASSIEQGFFFKNKGTILTAIKTHYIFPGVIELMQLLFQTERVKVSFFSSGAAVRNIEFVEKLLILSLDEEKYNQIKGKVRVLSRDDLSTCTNDEANKQHKLFGFWAGNNQKDISKVLCDGESLDNAILVEDDPSYAVCGQAKNLLYAGETNDNSFYKLKSSYHDEEPAKQVHHEANRIYYVAGMIFSALEESAAKGVSISDCLFKCQFIPKDEFHQLDFSKLKMDDFYLLGLENLRQVNPDLKFTTPEIYKECLSQPISDETRALLQAFKENEDSGCCIM